MAADARWALGATVNVIPSEKSVINDEVSFSTLLIDDFEGATGTKNMGRYVRNSHLYTNHIQLEGASASYRIVPAETERGHVLYGSLLNKGHWALVGCFLGEKTAGDSLWDFHAVRGLSFFVRGSGMLNVSFECDTLDRMGEYKQYRADILLPQQWQRIYISVDTLKFKPDENPDPKIPWDACARSVKRIEFNALDSDTVEFWLDDLMLEGVDFSAVY